MEAHRAGDVPVAIGRASDFFGAGGSTSSAASGSSIRSWPARRSGCSATPTRSTAHTYLPDFARALIELGRQDEALGEIWHVPTAEAVSGAALRAAGGGGRGGHDPGGAHPHRSRCCAWPACWCPTSARVIPEMWYEFAEPFVLDSSKIQRAFGLRPTPLEESDPATVEWYRRRAASAASSRADGAAA